MNKRLYVGNLSWDVTDQDLGEFFSKAGKVVDAIIIIDRDTGRSRGFGFVEMENAKEAKEAIRMFDGIAFNKRNIIVKKSREEHGEDQKFIRTIKNFVDSGSEVGDEIGFSSDDKHFTIKRDD